MTNDGEDDEVARLYASKIRGRIMTNGDEDDEEAGIYLSKTRCKIMTNDDEDDADGNDGDEENFENDEEAVIYSCKG